MFSMLEAYPRDISLHTLCTQFDDHFGHPTSRTKVLTEPTPAIIDETLQADLDHFKTATEDIRADTDWMQAIPTMIPLIDKFGLTERITELVISVSHDLCTFFC